MSSWRGAGREAMGVYVMVLRQGGIVAVASIIVGLAAARTEIDQLQQRIPEMVPGCI